MAVDEFPRSYRAVMLSLLTSCWMLALLPVEQGWPVRGGRTRTWLDSCTPQGLVRSTAADQGAVASGSALPTDAVPQVHHEQVPECHGLQLLNRFRVEAPFQAGPSTGSAGEGISGKQVLIGLNRSYVGGDV